MKRYWKFISLVTVIIVVFSVFYIHISQARSNVPEMSIKYISGDETLIEDLQIYIWYQDENNSRDLILSEDELILREPSSYLSMILQDFYPPAIKQLQSNYRSFMRDKQDMATNFFENEDIVAYANMKIDYIFTGIDAYDFTFEIEVLNKDTEKVNKFTVPVPKKEKYNHLFIEDVQLANENELKVITQNMLIDSGKGYELSFYLNHDEIHVYTFDLMKQTIVNDEIVNTVDVNVEGNLSYETMIIDHVDDIGPKDYIIFNELIREVNLDEDGHYDEQLVDNHLIVYHVETGEQKVLQLPEKIREQYSPNIYNNNGNFIYFESFTPDQYEVIIYNVEQEEIEFEQAFEIDKPDNNSDGYNEYGGTKYFVYDELVYMIKTVPLMNKEGFIQVRDIYSGDLLYEGQLVIDEKFAENDFYLEVHDIDFTRY